MSDQPAPASQPTDPAAGLDPAALLQRGISTTPPAKRPPPPTPAELEAQLPELAVHELIGQGGMGAVFRATQRNLDRPVALKVMARELGADPAFAARFVREAKAMARLTHPGIVAVHDFGQRGDLCWLVMELVDGANLREVMRTGRLSPGQALAIVPQLCDALQYAHDAGVIHRDIKPENILLDQRGRVKITDFGLAKVPESDRPLGEALTASGDRLGTVHYMAPEQVEGAKSVDHRADIYSLGVVFYEMLTGGLPLGRFEPPSRRIAVDVQIDEVVLKALEKDPQRRWQQASEVQRAVAVGTPVAVVAEAERTRPTFSRRDRRGFALGLIIAISVGIFTFAWSLLQETTAQSESPRSEPAAIRRLIEIGRFPEAREAILRLVQQDPGQSVRELQRDLDLAEARFLWRSGDLEKSGEAYRQALARHHGDQSVAQAMIADLPSTEPYAVDAVVELTQLSTPKEIEVAWRALRLRHGDPESFRSIVAMLARAPGTAIEARTHLGSDEAGVRWQALQVLEKAGVVTDADLIRFHTGNFLNGGYLVVKSGKDASPGISWDESVAWLMTAATAADWPARKSAAVLPDFYHLGWYLSRAEREEGDAIERLLLVAFPEQTLRQLDAWMAIPREGKDVPAAFMERLVHMRERLSAH